MLLFIGLGALFSWIIIEMTVVKLTGNAVRVSEKSFPEINQIYLALKKEMKLKEGVPIFIVQDGEVNGYVAKHLNRRFIILNSELVAGMKNGDQELSEIEWVIARFLGALKTKHFRFNLFYFLVDTAEETFVLNFLLKPYERATQFTGDNIGLLANKNLETSISAMHKIMIGNGLSKEVKMEAILHQAMILSKRSFFAWMAKAYSNHPYNVQRFLNLLGFAKKEFPDQFRDYVNQLEPEYRRALEGLMVVY